MSDPVHQTIAVELIAATVAAAELAPCVISPGSRSTPLVAALVKTGSPLVTMIDERSAAFYALGAARASGRPAVLVCTSGSAVAHYLPAIVEASTACVPLVVLTADRPSELHDCGASQTIAQHAIYGSFVRSALTIDGDGDDELALRAIHRKVVQAITAALGPIPGPVHLNIELRKPLEPSPPRDEPGRALAARATAIARTTAIAPPMITADERAIGELARAIARTRRGVVVVGAMPVEFAAHRDRVIALARAAGYPVIAESASQLAGSGAFGRLDVLADPPRPELIVQLGCEPVAAGWPAFLAGCPRWVLAATWRDPDSSAHVVLGDPVHSLAALAGSLGQAAHPPHDPQWLAAWELAASRCDRACEAAIANHPDSETALIAALCRELPETVLLQIANSLPIRVIDHAGAPRGVRVISQRGAAGIDGLIASAAGATWAGHPVVLVIGDVAFAHDVGSLLAARHLRAPLAIVVIDNDGGQIFNGLPVAEAGLGSSLIDHWLTPPQLDPVRVASAFGLAGRPVDRSTIASGLHSALTQEGAPRATVLHAKVSPRGARDVRAAARRAATDHREELR